MDYLSGLNPEQRQAVETLTGPVRILAGAGTGKTRTITHRIAHQILTGTFQRTQVMAVTFTERAAAELSERLLSLGIPNVRATTVHSAAFAQVRYFWKYLPGATGSMPTVLDNPFRIIAPMAKRLGVEASDLLREVDWAANADLSPEEVGTIEREGPVSMGDLAQVITDYTEAKQLSGVIDFHDMLRLATRLSDTKAIDEIRDRYVAFTVDEFQDTNALQWELIRQWDGGRGELCVVGDPCQSIFGFTGATSEYLTRFKSFYPESVSITLHRSYRSTPKIVAFTNEILPGQAQLTADPDREGPAPQIVEYVTDNRERGGVIGAITSLINKGIAPEEIAILVRLNVQTADWEQALWEANIPVVIPGDGSFYARKEVKAVIQALSGARTQEIEREQSGPPKIGIAPEPTPAQHQTHLDELIKRVLKWTTDTPIPVGTKAREHWQIIATIRTQARSMIIDGISLDEVFVELDARMKRQAHAQEQAVNLMTLHKSKGLEFKVVFLPACERGFIPVTQAKTEEEQAEEERLFYVGCTRAKEGLLISYAKERTNPISGKAQKRKPSPYIPESFLFEPGARPKKKRATGLPDSAAIRALREWRLERAREDDVPAFYVLGNKTLLAITEAMPQDETDLLSVKGMGPKKVYLYGEEILDALNKVRD